MISIELARKLKDAGLNWEPKKGDWFIDLDFPENANLNREDNPCLSREYFAWLPSLSQLLAEIERRNCLWYLTQYSGKYEFGLKLRRQFYADTPEEVAGQALLWILEQEVKDA